MPEKEQFAHIERYLQLGLIHLRSPRVIYWYGSGFGDFHIEWIDQPAIWEGTQVLHEIEQKTLELQREGTKDFPYLDYFEYMEKNNLTPI
ncbi:MAG TPA: hypothetical protein DD671_15425 [Balneolaceae bacterium]|nr:hypothetical protein [Balneolaceae bacterium]